MQDLYARLRIEPDAGRENVIEAFKLEPDLDEFSAILLDPDRRSVYDRTRATLKTIGELRHRLGLDSRGSWFADNYPDFAARRVGSGRREALAATDAGTTRTAVQPAAAPRVDAAARPRYSRGAFAAMGVVVAVVVIAVVLLARGLA